MERLHTHSARDVGSVNFFFEPHSLTELHLSEIRSVQERVVIEDNAVRLAVGLNATRNRCCFRTQSCDRALSNGIQMQIREGR